MTKLTTLQLHAFLRRWPLTTVAGLTLLGTTIAGVFEIYSVTRLGGAVLEVLAGFNRYSIVLPLVFAALTYEFTSGSRLACMQEAIDAHQETAYKHWLASMAPTSILVAGVFASYLAFRLAVVWVAGLGHLMTGHLVVEATLNVLAPSIVGVLLGALVGKHLSRYSGYALIALFAFLIGPYAEVVPMLAQARVADGRRGANLYPVYDLFRLLAPDPTWGMDALYGFPLELARWALAGAWILGLLALFLPAITHSKTRSARVARLLLAVLAASCLGSALLPGSVLRRDYRFFGGSSIVSEQIYYQVQRAQHAAREIPADFKVDRYDMRLTAGRQLRATVSVDISERQHSGSYRFTLYHGYRVKRVYDADGETLGFTQEGDYVTVSAPTELRQITFEYSGDGGICIANYQGVFLPGYFPYYPVPGFVRVWDDLRLAPIADVSGNVATRFNVRFESLTPLGSNLEFDNGRFQGLVVAPSFVGGLLDVKTVAGHRVVFFPASEVDPERLPELLARLRALERTLGLEESVLRNGTTVVQMPGLAQGETTALPDTLFLTGIDSSLASEVLVARMPSRADRENLKEAFARVLSDPASLEGLGGPRPSDDDVARLERARLAARSDLDRVQLYCNPAKSAVFSLFKEKVREQGSRRALRDTYDYLSSGSTMSELQFLTQPSSTEAQ